jgi:hypothetical protein
MTIYENEFTETNQSWSYSVTSNNVYSHDTDGDILKSQDYKFKAGGRTPNYFARKKAGEFFQYQPWSDIDRKLEIDLGSWSATGLYGYLGVNGSYPWRGTTYEMPDVEDILPPVEFDSLMQEAMARAYAQGHDSLTFLAEFHKIVGMFRNFVPNLARILREIRRNRDVSKDLAGLWLEARYGWRTLIYDMMDINDALTNFDAERRFYSERAGSQFDDLDTVVTTVTEDSDILITQSITTTVTYSYRGSASLLISPPQFAFNPITTAYELIPFSFVMDWFFNIGRALEAMSASAIATSQTTATGQLYTISRQGEQVTSFVGQGTGVSSPATFTNTLNVKNRVPTEMSYSPRFTIDMDAFKFSDLLALLYRS